MKILTPEEAAKAARMSKSTIYRGLEDGSLCAGQRVKGGRWAIEPECLHAWRLGRLCAHQQNVTSLPRRRRA